MQYLWQTGSHTRFGMGMIHLVSELRPWAIVQLGSFETIGNSGKPDVGIFGERRRIRFRKAFVFMSQEN